MPPRIQPHRLSAPSSCQCFRTRPQGLLEAASLPTASSQQTRQLHRRDPQIQKRLRRNMWEWLNGPGKAFREPLKGSTNYLSAYDRQGNIIRARPQRDGSRSDQEAPEEVTSAADEVAIVQEETDSGVSEADRESNAAKRDAARLRKAESDARGGLPRERPSDMRPYPLNQDFRSESVLSENLREELYRQVVERGVDISTVSAAFGVDTRRVAAVVRLKTIEKKWVEEGKPLAKPYQEAVLAMLPQTPYTPNDPNPNNKIHPHESVNDLPVHPRTRQQLFYPTSESRQFTREDAAKAFHQDLLPADKRIPHPELITLEREHLAGIPREERFANQQARDLRAKQAAAEAAERKRKWEERTLRVIPGRRWDFKFQDISAEQTGKNGRSRSAVGIRYGMPHDDRQAGRVKIPTSVE